jgi:AraC-like DNA-binding protein
MQGTRSWLDNLKLRAGFGVTGVIPGARYLSLTTWALGTPYYYDNGIWKQGLKVDQNPNPDLKWEKSTEYNVGLDFAVLGDRIWGSIDLYRKKTIYHTVDKYLDYLRLLRALKLLKEKPLYGIEAVAEEAGFNSVRTLQRKIQEAIGITPGQFRDIANPEED